jgi:hypothetical protein
MPANLGAEINDLHAKFPCLANREMFRMEQGDIRCRTGIESRDPRPIREIPGNSEVKVTSSGRRGGPRARWRDTAQPTAEAVHKDVDDECGEQCQHLRDQKAATIA